MAALFTGLLTAILALVLSAPPAAVRRVEEQVTQLTSDMTPIARRRRKSKPRRRVGATRVNTTPMDATQRAVRPQLDRASSARQHQFEVDATLLLGLIAAALAAGGSVPGALLAVGRAAGGERGATLRTVAAHLNLGASWREAWHEIADQPQLEPIFQALEPAWNQGAAARPLLLHAQRRLRSQRVAKDRQAARKLAVRLVIPVGVCYLPAFVLLGLTPVVMVLVSQGFTVL